MEYIAKANHRYNFKIGAVRSGKSYVDIAQIIPMRLLDVKGKDGLNVILGVSKESIERNVLAPMREAFVGTYISPINSRNIATIFGERVYCIGAEKANQVNQLQGMSIKYCYGDEIAKWNQDVFRMLQSRLDKIYSKFDGACNPEYPEHWLKKFIDRTDIDKYVQEYTIFDNPYLPQEIKDNLCKEYAGTVYYERYIKGLWALAEGLIFPFWEKCIEEPPKDIPEEYCLSIDYGTMNAFAALLWEKHKQTWYATKEYYYSGREEITGTKTDAQYVADMIAFVRPILPNIRASSSVFGGGEAPSVETIVDPSAASFIAALMEHDCFTVRRANNDVLNGIRDTARAMQSGRIKFAPWLNNWRSEVQGYVWQDRPDIDAPVKERDHCVTGNTIIHTKDGYKQIKDMVGTSGDVLSYNTKTRKAEYKPYHSVRMTMKRAKIYKITTKDGQIVRCTAEHPILTKRGYVRVIDLNPKDRIIAV